MLATDRRLVPSGVISVLAHAGVLGAAFLATLRPDRVADAASQPVILAWPQMPDGPPDPPDPRPGPVPPIDVPPQPPIGIPPIDEGLSFDGRPPLLARDTAAAGNGAAQVTGEPWSVAGVAEPPVLLAGPLLAYPEALRRAGIAGRVVVQAVIDTLGRVEPGSVIVESSVAGFAASARAYALGARFRPGRVNGRSVRVLVSLPIDFTLAPPR